MSVNRTDAAAQSPMEIEAKYAVSDPIVFDILLELEALGGFALHAVGEKHLIDHYLDTAKHDLLRRGYTCRVREGEVDGRWLLTVKALDRTNSEIHQREEHEGRILPNMAPAEWPRAAREIVTRLSEGRALTELFILRQHRVRRAVSSDHRAVGVLSLDTVGVDIAGCPTTIREIEIELTGTGTVGDLQAIGAELRRYRVAPQPESKFETALDLLTAASTGAVPLRGEVRADDPFAEAGRKSLSRHFLRMLEMEDGTRRGTDPEPLHDMRVATRRQRAIFRIVAPYFERTAIRPFRDELRTVAGHLGAVRDLDASIAEVDADLSRLPAETRQALEPLLDDWRAQRSAARAHLLTYLNGDRYREFIDRYRAFLSSPGAGVKEDAGDSAPVSLVRYILPSKIWRQYGRVRAYDAVLPHATVETLHKLRIQGKRLRYMLEFFSAVLGPHVAKAIEITVALQDHLGELHDADVRIGRLRRFLIHGGLATPNPPLRGPIEEYLKVTQARLHKLQRTVERPWREISRKRFRKLLAQMVAQL